VSVVCSKMALRACSMVRRGPRLALLLPHRLTQIRCAATATATTANPTTAPPVDQPEVSCSGFCVFEAERLGLCEGQVARARLSHCVRERSGAGVSWAGALLVAAVGSPGLLAGVAAAP
jgi:hypothetical protein